MTTEPVERAEPEHWVQRHGDYLYRYALFRLRDPNVAEEMVQETFIAALRNRAGFSGHSSERTWLVGILKHKLLDYLRRLYREKAAIGEQDAEDALKNDFNWFGLWAAAPGKWALDPEELLEQKEFWNLLHDCLLALPEKTAEAYSLREIDGLSAEEVCKVLRITPNNLWVRLHRARLALRRCLESKWGKEKAGKDR
jgi:RNA polymerase sigma-70 factor (ECF subfamily)